MADILPGSVRRGDPIRADTFNRLLDYSRSSRIQPGGAIRGRETRHGFVPDRPWRADVPRHYLPPPPKPFGKTNLWGIEISGATIKVYPGAIRRGATIVVSDGMDDNTPVEVTISAGATWIGWQYQPVSPYALIVMPDATATMPVDADGYQRGPLYQFGFSPADEEAGTLAAAWLVKDWREIIATGLFG